MCSIDHEIIKKILSDKSYVNKSFEDHELLEKKYFAQGNYRKIRKKLIMDIVNARIEEIASIILNKNINLEFLKQNNIPIYMIIEDELIFDNFKENFKSYFLQYEFNLIDDFKIDALVMSAAHLSIYGWKKEAIPITQTKDSLITRIFKSIFG